MQSYKAVVFYDQAKHFKRIIHLNDVKFMGTGVHYR